MPSIDPHRPFIRSLLSAKTSSPRILCDRHSSLSFQSWLAVEVRRGGTGGPCVWHSLLLWARLQPVPAAPQVSPALIYPDACLNVPGRPFSFGSLCVCSSFLLPRSCCCLISACRTCLWLNRVPYRPHSTNTDWKLTTMARTVGPPSAGISLRGAANRVTQTDHDLDNRGDENQMKDPAAISAQSQRAPSTTPVWSANIVPSRSMGFDRRECTYMPVRLPRCRDEKRIL